jgi:purine-nucleoside phosphorylase
VCCPDGKTSKTSKVDNVGTNCLPPPTHSQREFDQILSGDITITKLFKYKSIYKIKFSKKNISKVLLYQTWSSTSDDLNNKRVVTEIKATTWVNGAFRNVENNDLSECSATAKYAPVKCADGNENIITKHPSKRSVTTVSFQPTVVMELDNGQCPYHHKCKTCNKDAGCKHVFVLIRAVVNKNDQVVFYVSSKNIVLPSNPSQELKLLKKIPVGLYRKARFDIDSVKKDIILFDEIAADPFAMASKAAAVLAETTGVPQHDVAVVLGSGWGLAADAFGTTIAEIDMHTLPGFRPPVAEGHRGQIRSVDADGTSILVFMGRTHLYEGHGVDAVVHAVRTAAAAGCRIIVLTNGCGGLDPSWKPGTPVLISDHLNLFGVTPLRGATFIDMTDLYSSRLRAIAHDIDPSLEEGVYAQFLGPQYETPAEIGMVRAIGGTLVGMSTVQEAIAARQAGMEVLGLSLVTNLAAGMTGEPLSSEDVLAAGNASASRMGALLAQVIRRFV